MTLPLNIPDASAALVLDNFCIGTGWTIESGLTKQEWAKQEIYKFIRNKVERGKDIADFRVQRETFHVQVAAIAFT